MFEYRCPDCGLAYSSSTRGDRLQQPCSCGAPELKRVWGFRSNPGMKEHWNWTVNQPISSMAKFRSELSRASDEASVKTGIEHRYVPVDPQDFADQV